MTSIAYRDQRDLAVQRHAQRPEGEQREPPVRCSVKFDAL
jgi:hypothetical protein